MTTDIKSVPREGQTVEVMVDGRWQEMAFRHGWWWTPGTTSYRSLWEAEWRGLIQGYDGQAREVGSDAPPGRCIHMHSLTKRWCYSCPQGAGVNLQ